MNKQINIEDYLIFKNFNPKIISYVLFVLISNKYSNKIIKKYIKLVNQNLGIKISNNNYLFLKKKINFLDYKQYYITKWIYSLIIASNYLKDDKYFDLAIQLMITICKNINCRKDICLNNPLKKSYNILDIFITLMTLLINTITKKKTNYINLLIPEIKKIKNILFRFENISLYSEKQSEIGFLMVCCFKIRIIIYYKYLYKKYINIDSQNLEKLYFKLLKNSLIGLRHIKFNSMIINNDCYKWFKICIGLKAIYYLEYYYKNIFNDNNYILVKQILKFNYLKNRIINNFDKISYNKGNFNLCKDINLIIYLNLFNPILKI